MQLRIRPIEDQGEALAHAGRLHAWAADMLDELRGRELTEELVRARLEAEFDAPETVLLAAEDPAAGADAPPLGLLWTLPLADPLSGERLPLIAVLGVDRAQRHRGVARELVAAAARHFAAHGSRALAGRAAHNDDALISMGERWGFVRAWELMVRE